MTIQEILSGSGMQRIDAEVLLAHALGKERTWLYAHGEAKPDKQALDRWQRLQARRNRGEPVAYIVERQEFFGLPFLVNNNVLIPRPATEGLVQTALDMMKGEWGNGTRDIDADIVALSHLFGVPTATTTV